MIDDNADLDTPWEWPSWTDALGNTFTVGDTILVATINGKSPQMVVARVERINRRRSNGQVIKDRKWFKHPHPITKVRSNGTTYDEMGEYREVDSCTVTATPLIDGRNFTRWGTRDDEKPRKVTYSIPGNIVKAP